MREIDKIIAQHSNEGDYRTMTGPDFQECLKQAYNLGLQDAVDNAYVEYVDLTSDEIFDYTDVMRDDDVSAQVNKKSILKLKL